LKAAAVALAMWLTLPVLASAATESAIPSAAIAATLPVGTVTLTSSSATSDRFTVTCSGARTPLAGTLLIQAPASPRHGLVMFFSGGYGTTAWATNSPSKAWLTGLASAGYEVVQVEWAAPGWEPAANGEDAGQAHVACRPATIIRWVYDHLYVPLAVPRPGLGVCGFCVTGNSGGASQVSYALAYYGLGSIFNGVFPTSGPPHAALAKGCLSQAGYEYGPLALGIIDSSNGYFGSTGPCTRHDSSFTARWNQESVDTNGSSYSYPSTRVHFIFGALDAQSAKTHADDYISRLTRSGSPMVSQETVSGMAHEVAAATSGMAALLKAIEAGATSTKPSTSPSPSPSLSPSAPPLAGGSSPAGAPGAVVSPRSGSQPTPNSGTGSTPGGAGSSPLPPVGKIAAAISGEISKAGVTRAWLWLVIVGLGLAAAAILLIPRIPVLRRALRGAPHRSDRPPP
jgi:hypothetical protein